MQLGEADSQKLDEEETFSRYGHLMPGTRNQARELVDAYMDAVAA